jgi:glutathione S-transferase
MLQLFYSPTSPYVRKVIIVAMHLGVNDKIERLASAASPIDRDRNIAKFNPLTKVPSARTDDGLNLFDSRVICEYLDSECKGGLFPSSGRARWVALTQQALGDGLLDAALLARYESAVRPEALRWKQWTDGQISKVVDCLKEIEEQAGSLGVNKFTIGEITIACALGYLDFRYDDMQWRTHYPKAAEWFAKFTDAHSFMAATVPPKG